MVEGEITLKLGDDIITLGPRDAVLIPGGDGAQRAQHVGRAGDARDGLGDDGRSGRRLGVS